MAQEPVPKKPRRSLSQRNPSHSVEITGADGTSITISTDRAAAASLFFAERLPAETIEAQFLTGRSLFMVAEFCEGNIREPVSSATLPGEMPAWTDQFRLLEVRIRRMRKGVR